MLSDILTALALLLVVEGLLPFASPALYRAAVEAMASAPPARLRAGGLCSMIAGVLLLSFVR